MLNTSGIAFDLMAWSIERKSPVVGKGDDAVA